MALNRVCIDLRDKQQRNSYKKENAKVGVNENRVHEDKAAIGNEVKPAKNLPHVAFLRVGLEDQEHQAKFQVRE